MNKALKKQTAPTTDRIYVTGKVKPRALPSDDIMGLAIKLANPAREELEYTPQLKSLEKVNFVEVLNLETKKYSGFMLAYANSPGAAQRYLEKHMAEKLSGVLRSAGEKIYFMQYLKVQLEAPLAVEAFMAVQSGLSFYTSFQNTKVALAYFQKPKQKDEDRFLPLSLDLIGEGEKLENDMFLHFKRNNRYVKYVKKGGELDAKSREKLQKKGFTDLYIQSDQPLSIQEQLIQENLTELIRDFNRHA